VLTQVRCHRVYVVLQTEITDGCLDFGECPIWCLLREVSLVAQAVTWTELGRLDGILAGPSMDMLKGWILVGTEVVTLRW
jgi:hypothetical protein